MPNEIRYDHDQIAATVKEMRELASEMTDNINKKCDHVLELATQEASKFTADGKPAPIYKSAFDSGKTAMETIKTKAQEIIDHLNSTADKLEKASTDAQKIDDEAKTGIDKVQA